MSAWRLETHAELGSTSDECLARARAGEPDGLAVLALRQSAGRGTRGRSWTSLDGNLALSVLVRGGIAARDGGQWALLAGLAVLRALEPYAPPDSLRLKWPNDVTLHGDKLAGVLIEAELDAAAEGSVAFLVIGIGANLAAAPGLAERRAAALGGAAEPRVVAEAVLTHIGALRSLLQAAGSAAIHAAWLAHAHPVGTAMAAGGRAGRFAGLHASGALLLDDGALQVVPAGEITLPARAGR